MKPINSLPKVPVSRFKRELTSLLRRQETVCVTHNNESVLVLVPEGTKEFEFISQVYKLGESDEQTD